MLYEVMQDASGTRCLLLNDQDEFDYAKAERLFPRAANVAVEFKVKPAQNDHGQLDVELVDAKGIATMRLTFSKDGYLQQKNGYRMGNIMPYSAGQEYTIRIELTCGNRRITSYNVCYTKLLRYGIIQMQVEGYPNLSLITKPGSYKWPDSIIPDTN